MKSLIAMLGVLMLAGCPQDVPENDTGLAGFDPNLIENMRLACEQDGGRFGKGGDSGGMVCYQNTRDANKMCSNANQCEGLCLARSGTCAPVKPFFGCNEVFGTNGARSTVCIN